MSKDNNRNFPLFMESLFHDYNPEVRRYYPVANRELLTQIQAMVRIIRAKRERDLLIKKLQEALETIKTLSGMLPICASCKSELPASHGSGVADSR
jgi:hypothetical protein